jgi:hypothetical protein
MNRRLFTNKTQVTFKLTRLTILPYRFRHAQAVSIIIYVAVNGTGATAAPPALYHTRHRNWSIRRQGAAAGGGRG